MSEVILLYPKTGFDLKSVSVELPLSTIHAASLLYESGYKIKIIDQRMDQEWKKTLAKELKSEPLFVGISSMTGTQIHFGIEAAQTVREHSNARIVWGGVHPTILPTETLKDEHVDIVIRGDGERTALELAEALETGKPLSTVKGLSFKEENRIFTNPERPSEDINNFPRIPYELVDVKENLKNNGGLFSAIYSRGCPFRCSFCCNPLLSKRVWRTLKSDRIIEDLDEAYDKYKFKKLKFNDENFFVRPDRVDEISKFIGDKFEWECQARIDSVERFDFEILRKRGLYQIQPGIESGNDRVLELIHKDLRVQKIIDYNKKLSKTNIIATYNFMMGFPTETLPELYDSINLSLRLIHDNKHAEISAFYIYVPYPGCELYDLSIKEGFIPPKKLKDWTKFSRQQLYTPWIQDKKDILLNIALTSKFIDGRRINRLFEKTPLPKIIPEQLSKTFQKRWIKKDFKNHMDIKAINYIISKYVKVF